MTPWKGPGLTRRQALQGVGVALIVLSGEALAPRSTANASLAYSSGTADTAAIVHALSARCYAADWSTLYAAELPISVNGLGSARSDLLVDMTWDDRLFEVGSRIIVEVGNAVVTVNATSAAAGSMSFTLPAGATAFHLQPRVRDAYPAENIGEPVPSAIVIHSSRQLTAPVSASVSAPWGVELRAVWDTSGGYSYPAVIEVLSTGPYSAPSGLEIVARTFQGIPAFDSQTAVGVVEDGGAQRRNRFVDRAFIVDTALAPGETVRISLAPVHSIDDGGQASISQVGQVFLVAPEAAGTDARATGRYSIASVTSSGTELTDASKARKA